jgi:transcriptional regulator with XRE-family HTH domain
MRRRSCGLTFQQVQKYEKGMNRVSSSRLVDMANTLDLSIPYFFDEMSAAVSGQAPSELLRMKRRPENDHE